MEIEVTEIIDAHIHPAVSKETDFAWYQPTGPMTEQVATLRRAGISRACGSVVRWINKSTMSDIKELNETALRLRDDFPDFYIPAMHIHPDYPDESCAEIERMYALGVRWIGEIVGYIMGFSDYDSPGALQVYATAARLGMPVNIHFGPLEEAEAVCKALPNLNVVMAHPTSDKAQIENRLALMERCPNLHLDLSGSGHNVRRGLVRHAADRVGAQRLIFGSDYPICPPEAFLAAMSEEKLSDEERKLVMGGNFLRLTGLK